METKDITAMNRQDLRSAFDAWVEREHGNDLVDVKFCVSSGGATEDAIRQLLYIQKMEDEGKTRPYSDY